MGCTPAFPRRLLAHDLRQRCLQFYRALAFRGESGNLESGDIVLNSIPPIIMPLFSVLPWVQAHVSLEHDPSASPSSAPNPAIRDIMLNSPLTPLAGPSRRLLSERAITHTCHTLTRPHLPRQSRTRTASSPAVPASFIVDSCSLTIDTGTSPQSRITNLLTAAP